MRCHTSHALSTMLSSVTRTRRIDIQVFIVDGVNHMDVRFCWTKRVSSAKYKVLSSTGLPMSSSRKLVGMHMSRNKCETIYNSRLSSNEKEFCYWLKFICYNSTPRSSTSSAHKPLVLVVTIDKRKDKLKNMGQHMYTRGVFREWIQDVAKKFDDEFNY